MQWLQLSPKKKERKKERKKHHKATELNELKLDEWKRKNELHL